RGAYIYRYGVEAPQSKLANILIDMRRVASEIALARIRIKAGVNTGLETELVKVSCNSAHAAGEIRRWLKIAAAIASVALPAVVQPDNIPPGQEQTVSSCKLSVGLHEILRNSEVTKVGIPKSVQGQRREGRRTSQIV